MSLLAVFALVGCTSSTAQPTASATAAPERTGDEELLELSAGRFKDAVDQAALAVIVDGEARFAYISADASTRFEIGSITKLFTGELFAEAIERGEVAESDSLGQYLDLGDSPAAAVTLIQLATHSSGMPSHPSDPAWIERMNAAVAAGRSPYEESVEELLAEARTLEVKPDQGFEYSNIGAALLGQALAAAAGTDYATLLERRLLRPLGLEGVELPVTVENVSASLAQGHDENRRPVDPWPLGAYAPAGGIEATVGGLAAFAQAVLDGPLSGSVALEPAGAMGGSPSRIGYFWGISNATGRTITGHNGGTGGFVSVLMIDREEQTAAIVLSNRIHGIE
ncbi:serine hydrolase domain-containing protein, partial [Kitasatospora indigofera]|uniref:serine hydrolase domain-containing protein n=1 Tax=Kitasatospora indigofera TaxID=67307 RepID=UPI0036763304